MKIAYDQELSVKINFLSRIPCFEGLGDVLIRSIGEVAHWKECKDGEVLFREGDEVDSIYFIKSGKVQCYRRLKQKMVLVAELEANKYFNECYEVTKEGKGYRAKITVKAKGMVKLACITIQDSKTKFSFELPVSPIYHYSEKMLEKIMQQISEKGEWEKQKRKEMDRMAREKLKNPCANWDEFVIRKAQSAKRISEKNFKK
ncbi:hypothetical protein HMI56_000997 [Coelomomyces lativittatus]|nr:hypothetical protein HMI56_000997 [Coelomomyces lativittatus]